MDYRVREKINSWERRDCYRQTMRKEKSSMGNDHEERQGSSEHSPKHGSLTSHKREGITVEQEEEEIRERSKEG